MPKDTKSSGYNKAPACESRGFGHKKEGENFDTPSFTIILFRITLFCTLRNLQNHLIYNQVSANLLTPLHHKQ